MNQHSPMQDFAGYDEPAGPSIENAINVDLEQAVLGTLLMNNETLGAMSFLEPDDFHEKVHQTIYAQAKAMIDSGRVASAKSLQSFIPPDSIGGMSPKEYLFRLQVEAAMPMSAAGNARLLRDMRACRFGSACLDDACNAFLNRGADNRVSEIADEVIDHMMALKAMMPRGDSRANAGVYVDRFLSRVFEAKMSSATYVPFPLPEFEAVVQSGGWEPGNLYGLLGASGEGKTSLVLQIMRAAMDAGHPTLLLSYDQQGEQVVMQMASQARSISMRAISQFDPQSSRPTLNMNERDWLADEVEIIRQLPWYVEPLRDEKIGQIAKIAERFVKNWRKRRRPDGSEWGTPLIILDHNRKVTPDDPRAHEGRIAGAINGAGKAMAGELGAAVLFLNQRNGGGARRDVPRPIAADLFGGEQAREDYDAILYLYRAERWMKEKLKVAGSASEEDKIRARFRFGTRDPEGLAELGALKVRYGQDDVTELLKWEGRFTRYASERRAAPELF
ncbi:hypothetical protein D3218_12985 [Aureimonas flava]|uniref:DNA 5'-3' helicase n=1 Tax=Aureimonas flava TaxID=2320271 RepID=A0A3A1WIY3_9HYPH|nr:DnaB-like helicase C-terminal domain-containing protein [Aureimonas flava]RIY00196.1 hypothetical protein D3218_12985 [Aureimonas flava]